MKNFVILFISLFFLKTVLAQCCTPGNPVGGTTQIGILDKKAFRAISFYRYSFSEGYWEGNKRTENSFVKNGKFNYAGLMLDYGLSNKVNIETEIGYFISKSQTYNLDPPFTSNGFGFNNAVLSLKYNLINNTAYPIEWTIGGGAKIPFKKKYLSVDNVELPRGVQPSTHAFGFATQSLLFKDFPKIGLLLILINRFENNFTDIKNYQYGDILFSSLFTAKKLGKSNCTTILQIRHEWRDQDIVSGSGIFPTSLSKKGTRVLASGGNLIFIAPQINYSIGQKWNISFLADLPVYRFYNGAQMGNKFAFACYLSRDFAGKCEANEE